MSAVLFLDLAQGQRPVQAGPSVGEGERHHRRLALEDQRLSATLVTAHVLPDAIFPDVIDWDELRTGARHEGIYYGAKNFIRKLTTAFAIFLALQVLGWLGYQVPPEGATQFTQPASAVLGIRILTGPVAAAILCGVLAVTWYYPLDRQRHRRVLRLLARRQAREVRRGAAVATVRSVVD